MGIFKFFNRKKEDENLILSPTNGEILDISEVPDAVFSEKLMGDGFAIKSSDGMIVSPLNGTIEMLFDTKHAIGLKSYDGLEILIHLGIDTVKLNGNGFEVFVKQGYSVKAGQELIKMDLEYIRNNAKSDISPIIFTNLEKNQAIEVITGSVLAKEDSRIRIIQK